MNHPFPYKAIIESDEFQLLLELEDALLNLSEDNFAITKAFITANLDQIGRHTLFRLITSIYLSRCQMLDIIIPLLETFDETGEFILHYAAFALGYFTQFQFLTSDFGNFQYLFEKLHDMGVINSDLLNSIYIPKYCIDTNTEIEDAIIHDDADKLIKLHSENTRIDVKNLETFDFKESNRLNKPKRLIDCAAFYGASKCFNFLLLSGAGLTKNLMRNAIHDQNVDIIHKVDDEIASFPRTRYNISETKIMEMKKSLLFLFGYRKHRCSFTCQ